MPAAVASLDGCGTNGHGSCQMLALLTTRRFGPLFATQFLGAFNDNLFRTALVFIVAYDVAATDPKQAALLASTAAGLFILPLFPVLRHRRLGGRRARQGGHLPAGEIERDRLHGLGLGRAGLGFAADGAGRGVPDGAVIPRCSARSNMPSCPSICVKRSFSAAPAWSKVRRSWPSCSARSPAASWRHRRWGRLQWPSRAWVG